MATIFTVHGTNASGPPEGDKWWQRGSPFEAQLRTLVECEHGTLNLEPIVWDGENSETSRREAGRSLGRRLDAEEQRGAAYGVLGHSHGGSVIGHALMEHACRKAPLDRLSFWITVGTPFIATRRHSLLFSRLGAFGKVAYVSYASFLLVMIIFIVAILIEDFDEQPIKFLLIAAAVGAALYALLRASNRRRFRSFGPKPQQFFAEHFMGRWIGLWHDDDEAIHGLRIAGSARIKLFPSSFAVPVLTFAALFLIPFATLVIVSSPRLIQALAPYLPAGHPELGDDGKLIRGGENIAINIGTLIEAVYGATFKLLGSSPDSTPEYVTFLAALLGFPILLFVLSFVALFLVSTIAHVVSATMSRALDRLTGQQIKSLAFGSDCVGETCVEAGTGIAFVSPRFQPLPEPLAGELTELSNAEAAKSVGKLRSALGEFAFTEGDEEKNRIIQSYLTWGELIHTSYFAMPRFVKLIAYAISKSPGFRATTALKADPDYEVVAKCYEEIQRTAVTPTSAAASERSLAA